MKFALFFGNRGFCPGELVAEARDEMTSAVKKAGHEHLCMEETATKYGAVETIEDGEKFAAFLKQNDDQIGGVVLCMPNFSDENGAVAALKDFKKPILIQAYPDEIGKMDFSHRRDAYCGKFSVMDMFYQTGIKFTAFAPHVCKPLSKEFLEQLDKFGRICSVVNNMKQFKLGVFGARTTAYKTVRYDELALQRYGITTETFDLSDIFHKIANYSIGSDVEELVKELKAYSDFSRVSDEKISLMAKTVLVIKQIIKDYRLDAIALRCWNEFPQILKISACAIISYLNEIGIPCACEVDVCNAVAMKALCHAAYGVSTCLDWNNNYGDAKDKCILFHCGPVPQSMMVGKGTVGEHLMFKKSYGDNCSEGVNEGRIRPGKFTYAGCKTENGKIQMYVGEGAFTSDEIEKEYFGCAAVAKIKNLDNILLFVGKNGHRHHCTVAFGEAKEVLFEALTNYLAYEIKVF
jgi:L-fucose isomerase-like protein